MRTFVICILAVVFFFSAMPVMAQGDDDFVERIQECANRSGSFKDLIIQGDQAVVVLKVMDLYYETWNVKDSSFDQAAVSVSCVDLNVSVFQLKKAHSAYVSNEKVYSHEVFWVEGLGSAGNDGNFISYSQVVWYDQSGLQSIAISDMDAPSVVLVESNVDCWEALTNIPGLDKGVIDYLNISLHVEWELHRWYSEEDSKAYHVSFCDPASVGFRPAEGKGIFHIPFAGDYTPDYRLATPVSVIYPN